jgi:glycine cleavage system aminomethyltransferase T
MAGSKIPEDGSPIVSENLPVGRVTSSRRSPITGQGFGLVWVPADMAEEGRVVHVRVGGEDLPAELTFIPSYDPEGIKLRE